MLSKVDITGYRGFRHYQMKGLSRVNLLVGRNNSGKTALLEGLHFLTSGGDPSVLGEIAERRGEIAFSRPEPTVQVDITHFFHGHTIIPDAVFSFVGDNGYLPVHVKTILEKAAASGADRPNRITGLSLQIAVSGNKGDEPRYRISRDGAVDLELGPRYRGSATRRKRGTGNGPQVRFVGTDSVNTIELAEMWDEVTITGQEIDISGAMRILEPKLESLHFLTGLLTSGYFPARGGIVVGMKGQEGRVPLGSMGDGMRRMMALATSLAFTRDGCLFVDEIDTGLHYSVMADMWKLIIEKAVSSNTQVFATTHSWDCIAGLSQFCQQVPEHKATVAVHKIDSEIPNSIEFTGESLVRMVKGDIDPR